MVKFKIGARVRVHVSRFNSTADEHEHCPIAKEGVGTVIEHSSCPYIVWDDGVFDRDHPHFETINLLASNGKGIIHRNVWACPQVNLKEVKGE